MLTSTAVVKTAVLLAKQIDGPRRSPGTDPQRQQDGGGQAPRQTAPELAYLTLRSLALHRGALKVDPRPQCKTQNTVRPLR